MVRKFSPRNKKMLDLLARVICLLIFGIALYQTEYLERKKTGFYVSIEWQWALNAANLGHPFYYYTGDMAQPFDENKLMTLGKRLDDHGVIALALYTSAAGRVFDDDFTVSNVTVYQAMFVVFMLTALAFLWPTIPLPLSIAGLLAFGCGLYYGPIDIAHDARSWGLAYTTLMMGMIVVTAALPKKNLLQITYLVLLAGIIGFTQFFRQEGNAVVYGASLGLMVSAWAMTAVAYAVNRTQWKSIALPFARRVTLSGAAVIAAMLLSLLFQQATYAAAWDQKFTETRVPQHGAGLSLYMGLGYLPNPYNIMWLDEAGGLHLMLYEPDSDQWMNPNVDADNFVDWTNDGTHEVMLDAYLSVIKEDPDLFFENLWEKAQFLHQFLATGEMPFPSKWGLLDQSQAMQNFYLAALVMGLLSLLVTLYLRHPTALLYTVMVLATAFGAAAGSLLGFPSYIAGPQAASIFITLVLPVALLTVYLQKDTWDELPQAESRRVFRGTLILGGALVLIAGLAIFAAVRIQENNFREKVEKAAASDPMTQIQQLEFRYDAYFNSMTRVEQEAVIEQLLARDDAHVARPVTDSPTPEVFRPVVAVLSENQLHLIVWLGKEYAGPVDFVNQAQIHTYVQVCVDCQDITRNFNYQKESLVYAYLHDESWRDEYRMLSFAVDTDAFLKAERLLIVPQRIRFMGGNATTYLKYMVDEPAGVSEMEFGG